MIIKSVVVEDYRVFRGEHIFDLEPRIKYGAKRPIVLFGGLNGAGKTSILSAIKLSLYGKQSIGGVLSQKAYENHLRDSIHRAKDSLVKAQHASVKIVFSYAHMGVVREYRVERSWQISGKSIDEYLNIYEDGKHLSELTTDQCQGFLNELIPVGVSELFFFDGEKIKELAEDTGGDALGEAIKRLLGLDIIDSLQTDLSTLLRRNRESNGTTTYLAKVKELKENLQDAKHESDKSEKALGELKCEYVAISEEIQKFEQKLSEQGGAWAQSREQETQSLENLERKQEEIEEECRQLISSTVPFSIPDKLINKLERQLSSEADLKDHRQYEKKLLTRVEKLKSALRKEYTSDTVKDILSTVDKTLLPASKEKTKIIHDLSSTQHDNFLKTIAQSKVQADSLKNTNKKLKAILTDIEKRQDNLRRVPEQNKLQDFMENLLTLQKKHGAIENEYKNTLEHYRRSIRLAIDCTRKLKKLENESMMEANDSRALKYAQSSKSILKDFSEEMAARKTKDLESEFLKSMDKLARKSDMDMRAKIDPVNFRVELVRKDGTTINKNELSAGEKQIYAISILEALARTSGRKLPIIIDTPLGRLDSHHRENLVKHYFPHASHQVIILSTDTEIDQNYVSKFSTHISHAFRLNYNKTEESSSAIEGYFWRIKDEELVT